ncbi:MAG TPA: helix-turn-helix domain-containing protein [Polyangiaceae bacterium]|nr:helix-turn-helix domain-containing protein [Polyangiaceae bacterium]
MTAPPPSPRVLSAVHLARLCGVDLKTIHNWYGRGKIPGWRTPGRHLRFRRIDVVDFLRTYGFDVPDSLRSARPRVMVVDADGHELAATVRALTRRFDVVAHPRIVDALVGLAAADADVLVLGEIPPLDPGTVMDAVARFEPTRHVRVVRIGSSSEAAGATAPRGDATSLRETLEHLTGL